MNADQFEANQRAREWFHGLRLLPGAWPILRIDGRSFTTFTEKRYEKPFDLRFSEQMVAAAESALVELGGCFAFTESDEISVLLAPTWDMFDRSLEKAVSVSAGIASAAFTHACGEPAHFDSRVWLGTGIGDVVDYFSWRQSDATRCALNGWCYWTLRGEGMTAGAVTRQLERTTVADKNQLLFERGINFNDVPAWQRRGVGLTWETFIKPGLDPRTNETVDVVRRRVRVDRDLPMKNEFRSLVEELARVVEESS